MNDYVLETFAFDAPSVRELDKNGFLHVKVSHLTKAQVAPYRGAEIPGWEALGLDPQKIYKAYRPAEELSKPETIKSVNGIPIQLEHHADFARSPAKETRIGSTGDEGEWSNPYLNNSLHFQDQKAIDLIYSGSMRELSLAYRYKPDFTPGETPEGESYDFVMRDIFANHVALVEEGRAGRDVLVMDSSLNEGTNTMADEKEMVGDDPAIEQKEVALAQEVIKRMGELIDLHKQNSKGEIVDATDEDKDAAIKRILEEMIKKGLKPEDAESFVGSLNDLAYSKDEGEEANASDEGEMTDEGSESDQEGEDLDELDEVVKDALRACGYDSESEEFQRAFAEGVRYGEKKEKEEPKHLDRLHESEGEKKALGEDSAIKLAAGVAKAVNKGVQEKFEAIDDVKQTLGNIKWGAFDTAGDIYLAALKEEGFDTKAVDRKSARTVYLALMAGKSEASKGAGFANDSATKGEKPSLIGGILSNIKKE